MADAKISALTNLTAADAINDMIPIVDVSDTPPASGNTKRISINNILSSSPTASGALTVTGLVTAGSATITGDLTVRTNKLRVTSIGVGANTLTPAAMLHSTQSTSYEALTLDSDSGLTYCTANWRVNGVQKAQALLDFNDDALLIRTNTATGPLKFGCNNIVQYQINPLGVFSWTDGASGTRMTLNSTGLGIGGSPSSKLYIQGTTQAGCSLTMFHTGIQTATIGIKSNGSLTLGLDGSSGTTDRLLIDTSGNVGVGVTPGAWRTSVQFRALQIGYTGAVYGITNSEQVNLSSNYIQDTSTNDVRIQTGFATKYQQAAGIHSWSTAISNPAGSVIAFTQAMTLDASGNLMVGKTSTAATVGGGVVYLGRLDSARDTGDAATFQHTTLGNTVGSISITAVATAYNTSSDYRLKESVQPLAGGLARVNSLKPSTYKWNLNGSAGEGFLAHELAEVVPFAVSGQKDAVNEDGSIKIQGVDLSKIVPILVAAIQELTAEVNALKNA